MHWLSVTQLILPALVGPDARGHGYLSTPKTVVHSSLPTDCLQPNPSSPQLTISHPKGCNIAHSYTYNIDIHTHTYLKSVLWSLKNTFRLLRMIFRTEVPLV